VVFSEVISKEDAMALERKVNDLILSVNDSIHEVEIQIALLETQSNVLGSNREMEEMGGVGEHLLNDNFKKESAGVLSVNGKGKASAPISLGEE